MKVYRKFAPLLHGYVKDEFLRDVPADADFGYKITSAIARILFTKPETVDEDGNLVEGVTSDGIVYPSIRADKLG